jgi:hypothetical protein
VLSTCIAARDACVRDNADRRRWRTAAFGALRKMVRFIFGVKVSSSLLA